MIFGRRASISLVLAVLLVAGFGLWLAVDAGGDAGRRHVVVGGVPLDEVHPPAGERRPGVVVAHGFAGSAKLMAQFGDSLAARGYVVVLLDFAGHGANTRGLPDDFGLASDLDVAVAHLRSLPDVDPARTALVGHSMGAGAVTRYAVDHPEITATVALSLPDSSAVTADLPKRLLMLVGQLEFPSFHAAAERPGRPMVVVPYVEHISILYAPRTHRETADWLDDSFGVPAADGSMPAPFRRISGATLLLLAFLAGLYPVARLLLGAAQGEWPRLRVPRFGRMVAIAAVAAIVGAVLAPVLPTNRLPLALGGYIVGLTAVAGLIILGLQRRPGPAVTGLTSGLQGRPGPAAGAGRLAVAGPLLIGYAGAAIAVPMHLGLTHAIPVGARWWLLALVWAGFAILAHAAERATAGNSFGVLAVSAVTVVALTGSAVAGLTSSFVLLVVPLLAVLLVWQAIWSAVLHRFSAPSWLIALVGSLVVAWPIATALPLTG